MDEENQQKKDIYTKHTKNSRLKTKWMKNIQAEKKRCQNNGMGWHPAYDRLFFFF